MEGTEEGVGVERTNFLIYFVLLILLLFFCAVFFIKLRFPFWNTMPMFHTYDVGRYFIRTPCILPLNKGTYGGSGHCNFEKVKTFNYGVVEKKDVFLRLLQKHYLTTEHTFNTNTIEDIDSVLTGNMHPSFLSFYLEPTFSYVEDSVLPVAAAVPIGCIASHAFWLRCTNITLPVYYLDFLSIDKKETVKKRQLIQTHLSNQHALNPAVQVSLFKKEGAPVLGLVPFVRFKTRYYSLLQTAPAFPPLTNHYTIVRIYKENTECLHGLANNTKFDISVIADVPNIISMVKRGLLYAFVLKRKKEICGMYFVKDERTEWANVADVEEGTSIRLIASWNNTFPEMFYRGFLHLLREIVSQHKTHRILKMDDISDNGWIESRWGLQNRPFLENDNSYYFHHFIYPYHEAYSMQTKCFILI